MALTLDDAIKLYQILGPYLPDEQEAEDYLDYVDVIIKRIRLVDGNPAYLDALEVISGEEQEELVEKEVDELLSIFVDGLVDNEIIHLKYFCEGLASG